MFIKIPTYKTIYSATPFSNAIGFIGVSNFAHLQGTGRIELAVYADLAAAEAGLTPIARRSYPIPAADAPATPGKFALPALKTIEANNAQVFTALVAVFYGLILGDPELPGAAPA